MDELEHNLKDEASRATSMLAGKTVSIVRRHSVRELAIEFSDGTRLFADVTADSKIEISITGHDAE